MAQPDWPDAGDLFVLTALGAVVDYPKHHTSMMAAPFVVSDVTELRLHLGERSGDRGGAGNLQHDMSMPFWHARVNSDILVRMADTAPRGSVRVEHAERTRARILDAVVTLVAARGDCDFTMPQVANVSGVSLRTLYRYFATRQHVVDAVATVADQAAESNLPTAAFDLADLGPWLEQAWRNLLEHEAFIRAQHASPNGAAIRRARIPFFREVTRTLLLREAPDLAPERVDDVVDTALLLVSSSALFEFVDVLEIPVERAARLAAEAIANSIDSARRRE